MFKSSFFNEEMFDINLLPYKDELSEEKIEEINNLKIQPRGKSNYIEGEHHNRLTLLGRAPDANNNCKDAMVYVICDCKDHNITRVRLNGFRNGRPQSCGCLQQERLAESRHKKALNLTSQKIGDYIMIKDTGKRTPQKNIIWLAECPLCGHQIEISTGHIHDSISNPHICPCQKKGGSILEQKIASILDENNIQYYREMKFDSLFYPKSKGNPRFDFFLPEYNCFVEANGKQHYLENSDRSWFLPLSVIQARDQFKINWAIDNGYQVITIPYTAQNDITLKDLLPNSSDFLSIKKEVDNDLVG